MKSHEDQPFEITTPSCLDEAGSARAQKTAAKESCIRCGSCCTNGGPVLLKADLPQFIAGVFSYENIYAVREGESIALQGESELYQCSVEIVKIREKEGTKECLFYRGKEGCGVYDHRPAHCRAYKCWSPGEIITGLEEQGLRRSDFFASVASLSDVITRHEEKCSYRKLSEAIERLSEGDESAADEVLDMLQYDTYARPFLEERFGIPPEAMDLLLGRPLVSTIGAFGLEVVKEGDEYLLQAIRADH